MHILKVVLIFGILAFANAKLPRMRIHRDKNFMKTLGNVNAEKTHILNKHNMEMDEANSCYEEVESFNLLFYGYIAVGTPPQNVKVVFDTVSHNLYVPKTAFNSSASNTFISVNQNIKDFDPMKLGTKVNVDSVGGDIVEISDLTIMNQVFGIIDESLTSNSYQGLLGLGSIQKHSQAKSVGPPVLDNMYRQGLITEKVFSLYMMTNSFKFNMPTYGGELIFGGSDDSLYTGNLNYINSTFKKTNDWSVPVESIVFDGKTLSSGFQAVLDTGTDLIGCSTLDYALINGKLNGYVDEDGNYFVNCSKINTFPNIVINVNKDISVTLTPQEYIVNVLGSDDTTLCMSVISFTSEKYWILGTPFLSKFYLEFDFDNARIGFATPQPVSPFPNVPISPLPYNPLPKKICSRLSN